MEGRNVFASVISIFIAMWFIGTCQREQSIRGAVRQSSGSANNTSITITQEAADGLDLKALTALVTEVKSAEDLETRLNTPGGLNNMDLNDDGQVDFISVTEYGDRDSGAYGFSLTIQPAEGETQEVATIEITKEGDRASITTSGNEQIYGSGYYYRSYHPLGSFLLWSYLLSPHPFYYSPWGWGYYPSFYSAYRPVGSGTYRSRAQSTAQRASVQKTAAPGHSGLRSPNAGKSAGSGITRSLRRPTATQRAFQTRSSSRRPGAGGFGSSSTRSRSYSSYRSARGYSGSRSYSSFGK